MNGATAEPVPGRTRQRFEDMYRIIRTRISLLDYEPGQRLSEEVLAEEFGVSRTPIRDAMVRLEAEGLITHQPRQGAVVRSLSHREIMELYEMRQVLEGTAARNASVHASEP